MAEVLELSSLTEKEQNLTKELVSYLRKIPYGIVAFTVKMQDSQPVILEIEKAKESKKL